LCFIIKIVKGYFLGAEGFAGLALGDPPEDLLIAALTAPPTI
jgi:hypothetical protein